MLKDTMTKLTERQKIILALVIRDYTEIAQPVGSRRLVEHYQLDVSSATVRNEMVALTEKGYLRQPHTSAGRVPTEEGYRYFVRQLMGQTELPVPTKRTITHQFYQAGSDMERWMRPPGPGCLYRNRPSRRASPVQTHRINQHERAPGLDGAGLVWRRGQAANACSGRTRNPGSTQCCSTNAKSTVPRDG